MKIVINACYGGFGLSDEAKVLYASKIGREIFFYEQTRYKHECGEEEYTRVPAGTKPSGLLIHSTFEDAGEKTTNHPGCDNDFYVGDIPRDDANLVAVIEEMGCKAASDEFASLKIVEVPDGINWEVVEYDGFESVHEEHRTWS